VCDPSHDHEPLSIVHCVDDAVVTDAEPVVISPGKLHRAMWTRIWSEPVDRRSDPFSDWPL
jgi:hypothetical protein